LGEKRTHKKKRKSSHKVTPPLEEESIKKGNTGRKRLVAKGRLKRTVAKNIAIKKNMLQRKGSKVKGDKD